MPLPSWWRGALAEARPEDWEAGGFALYVHWPFCASKCPYCDFNSHVAVSVDQARWAAAFESEIARLGAETGPRVLRSVFFGGGTPSLMEPGVVDRVLRAARAAWPFANDIEVTLEANPTSVEAGRFADYAGAGVNRISMGVQALRDADLRRLGRMHSVAEARAAFDIARGLFGRVSFDLIYARQDQTVAEWRAELSEAMAMAVDHLSLYQLTIEEGTVFAARHAAGQLRGLPDEDRAGEMWDVTQEVTTAAGFGAYEVSNHAAEGAESRHNLIYWRYGDYAGVGPGAHGRLTVGGGRWATEGPRAPGAWLAAAEAGCGEMARERLSREDQRAEFLLMGMRLREGVDRARLARFGDEDIVNNINKLVDIGMVETEAGRLRVTQAGRPLLNAVLRGILGA
jgi:putative oxygen-independent coproporphyrinogen III oxidase